VPATLDGAGSAADHPDCRFTQADERTLLAPVALVIAGVALEAASGTSLAGSFPRGSSYQDRPLGDPSAVCAMRTAQSDRERRAQA
jgi:uncharacterized membrane protein YidH (DUF202 family)